MAHENILFDKTEIVMTIVSKRTRTVNLSYEQIVSVSLEPARERRYGIFPYDSERIVIRTRIMREPFAFYKSKEKHFFDLYKKQFRVFCKENRVTFYDKTAETEQVQIKEE